MSRARNQRPDIYEEVAHLKEEQHVDFGGNIHIRCSGCDAHLVSLVVTRPDAPVHSEVVAECSKCGDKSFIQKVDGMFSFGNSPNIKNMRIIEQKSENNNIYMKILFEAR